MNIWPKDRRCPKCNGNVYIEKDDTNQWVRHCLLCGRETNLDGSPYKSPFVIQRKRNWLAEKAEAEITEQGICYPSA